MMWKAFLYTTWLPLNYIVLIQLSPFHGRGIVGKNRIVLSKTTVKHRSGFPQFREKNNRTLQLQGCQTGIFNLAFIKWSVYISQLILNFVTITVRVSHMCPTHHDEGFCRPSPKCAEPSSVGVILFMIQVVGIFKCWQAM